MYIIFSFKASKRQPGTSGRLHRTVTGEWVWSSEEDSGTSSSEESKEALPINTVENLSSDDDGAYQEEFYEDKSAIRPGAIHASELKGPINLVLRLR